MEFPHFTIVSDLRNIIHQLWTSTIYVKLLSLDTKRRYWKDIALCYTLHGLIRFSGFQIKINETSFSFRIMFQKVNVSKTESFRLVFKRPLLGVQSSIQCDFNDLDACYLVFYPSGSNLYCFFSSHIIVLSPVRKNQGMRGKQSFFLSNLSTWVMNLWLETADYTHCKWPPSVSDFLWLQRLRTSFVCILTSQIKYNFSNFSFMQYLECFFMGNCDLTLQFFINISHYFFQRNFCTTTDQIKGSGHTVVQEPISTNLGWNF